MRKLILLLVLGAIVIITSSCARNGYGCQGRGKIITRVRQ